MTGATSAWRGCSVTDGRRAELARSRAGRTARGRRRTRAGPLAQASGLIPEAVRRRSRGGEGPGGRPAERGVGAAA